METSECFSRSPSPVGKGQRMGQLLLILGVLLFPSEGGYGLAQEPQEETVQEAGEPSEVTPQEKQPFFQKMLDEIGDDMATSEAIIQVGPRVTGQSGQLPVSSKKGTYEGGEWVVAPVPISNPTLGSGLAGGGRLHLPSRPLRRCLTPHNYRSGWDVHHQ